MPLPEFSSISFRDFLKCIHKHRYINSWIISVQLYYSPSCNCLFHWTIYLRLTAIVYYQKSHSRISWSKAIVAILLIASAVPRNLFKLISLLNFYLGIEFQGHCYVNWILFLCINWSSLKKYYLRFLLGVLEREEYYSKINFNSKQYVLLWWCVYVLSSSGSLYCGFPLFDITKISAS